jgi:ribosomal protein S18 acetylase RimI-like enzyme
MKSFRKIAGTLLRLLQNVALYRRIGRRVASGITLREATDADQLAVQRWLNPNSNPADVLHHNPNATDWIAEVHGQLAGFVQLVRYPPENAPYTGYWLFSLYTKSRWQGLGIGEALSQAVIERARIEGASVLDLVVYEDNVRAIRLYRKFGFEMYTIPELEPQLENERIATGRRRVVMRKQLSKHL